MNDAGHTPVWPYLEWLEKDSGRDLTPCFDGDKWVGNNIGVNLTEMNDGFYNFDYDISLYKKIHSK